MNTFLFLSNARTIFFAAFSVPIKKGLNSTGSVISLFTNPGQIKVTDICFGKEFRKEPVNALTAHFEPAYAPEPGQAT